MPLHSPALMATGYRSSLEFGITLVEGKKVSEYNASTGH